MLLTIISGYARLLSRTGSESSALAPLACVLTHVSANGEAAVRANEARPQIEAALGPEIVEAALAAGPPADLFAFAAALIAASSHSRH